MKYAKSYRKLNTFEKPYDSNEKPPTDSQLQELLTMLRETPRQPYLNPRSQQHRGRSGATRPLILSPSLRPTKTTNTTETTESACVWNGGSSDESF
jgi:hypothetical protein